jgi:hypothetical protein
MSRDSVTTMPARGDQIRMGIGIIGIGTSGPLIAMSVMPIWVLIFWRNLGGSIFTAPFAIRHHPDRKKQKSGVCGG